MRALRGTVASAIFKPRASFADPMQQLNKRAMQFQIITLATREFHGTHTDITSDVHPLVSCEERRHEFDV
jgi:hypothetical protein